MAEKHYPDIGDEYPTLDDLEAMPWDERKKIHLRELPPEELYKIIETLEVRIKDLEKESITDPLTWDLGVFNRRYFEIQLKNELSKLEAKEDDLRAKEYISRHGIEEYVSILFIDLNNLKRVNDDLGHLRGDEVLRETARVLSENIRPSDVVCRYGGDEFVVILPGADEDGAEVVADRIYTAFESKVASKDYLKEIEGFGISIGMATTHYQISAEDLIKKADCNMYEMKRKTKGE
jgi:diguanylate cyclase (GGDEF)-like protein